MQGWGRGRRSFPQQRRPQPPSEAPITTVIPQNASRQFAIYVGSEPVLVDGRIAAVDEAKEISRRTARPIRVERADGRVRMEFRRGALESYRFETRDRRS